MPLWKLLADRYNGGKADESAWVYAAGGYYYPGQDHGKLKDEMVALAKVSADPKIKQAAAEGIPVVIINSGGALLIALSGLVQQSPGAMAALVMIR